MAQQYGTVKVDVITYTSGTGGSETDQSITVSSLATISRTGIIVTGDIEANNITANSGLNVGGLADVSGLVVGQDATITGNLVVGSGISASSLVVQDGATVSGNLGVSGLATVSGLTVTSNATISGNLEVSGDTEVEGNLAVSGNATVTGDVTVSGGLEVSGNAEVEGNLQVSGDTTVTGNVSISGNLDVNGDINASGVTISGFTGLFTDGTAADPSISFASDPDTGFFRRSANSIGLTTSGLQRFYVTSAGAVTIANSSDTDPTNVSLTVQSLAPGSGSIIQQWGTLQSGNAFRSCLVQAPDTDDYNDPFVWRTANSWCFQVDDFRSFNIDPAGRVGIGTQTPGPEMLTVEGSSSGAGQFEANIQARLHIRTRDAATTDFEPGGPGLILSARGMNTTNKYTPAVIFASTDNAFTTENPKAGAAIVSEATETYNNDTAGGMEMSFWTSQNQPGATASLTKRMLINNNGRVGINATNLQGARLCIGENADNGIILRLNTDRPWQFKNLGTGSSSELSLEATSGGKNFSIRGNGGDITAQFRNDPTTPINSRVLLVPTANGGRVGIGTLSPQNILHITGGVVNTVNSLDTNNQIRIDADGNVDYQAVISYGQRDPANASTYALGLNALSNGSASNVLVGYNGGGVGLGNLERVPADTVCVRENLAIAGPNPAAGSGGSLGKILFRYTSAFGNRNAKIEALQGSGSSSADLCFYTRKQNDADNDDGGEERLRITSNGRVGINMPTPNHQLDVTRNGDCAIFRRASTGTGATQYIRFTLDAAGNTIRCLSTGNTKPLNIQNDEPTQPIYLKTTNASSALQTVITVTAAQRVGINKIDPAYSLHLNADSAAKPGTNTWTINSDARLKENIQEADLNICYDVVKNLPLKRFKWRDDIYDSEQVKDRHKIGWIAQDVQTAFPKAVTSSDVNYNQVYSDEVIVPATLPEYDENGELIKEETEREVIPSELISQETVKNCLQMNADQIYAAMYGAVQKLIQKVESLEGELNLLKGS